MTPSEIMAAHWSRHEQWVRDVRDPAERAEQIIDTIATTSGSAAAQCCIAELYGGRWAVRVAAAYQVGDCAGVGIPWEVVESHEAAVTWFLARAAHHFREREMWCEFQKQAQREITALIASRRKQKVLF